MVGAHSSQTVLGVGSSIALSSVLPVRSPSRSASSMTITWWRRLDRGQRRAVHQLAHVVDVEHRGLRAGDAHVGVRPGQRGAAGVALAAAGAALALQRGGERQRHVGAAGPGRPGEQPGVGHALAGDRRAQRRDRVLLPDQGAPHAPCGGRARQVVVTRRARGCRCAASACGAGSARCRTAWSSSGRSRRPDLARRSRRPAGGRPRRGSAPGRAAASCRNISRTRSWNSTDSASIRSRSSKRVSPCCGGRSSSTVRCGRRSPVAQRATRSTSRSASVAPGALVGQRRVDVAVGDHDRPAGQRRARPPGRRARPCRRRRAAPRCGARCRRSPGRARSGGASAPTSVSPGSWVSSDVVPLGLEPVAQQPGPGSTCRPPRRPRTRRSSPVAA